MSLNICIDILHKMSRQGDWKCPECGYDNFASRDACGKCKCWRSKAFKNQPIEKKRGDWNCPCGELNFASRTECRKCGKGKQSSSNTQNPSKTVPVAKPGDWYCACGTMNFGSRNACYGCGNPKETQNNQSNETETCIICMERKKDTVITKCGHLGYCNLCALNMNKCPICRVNYNPDTDLLKVFQV